MNKRLKDMKNIVYVVTIPCILAGVPFFYSNYKTTGLVLFTIGLLIIPFVYLVKNHSSTYEKVTKAIEFVSKLEHCQNFCATTRLEWPFADEIKVIKSRDKILNISFEKIENCQKGEQVYLITNYLNLNRDMWRLILEKSKDIKFNIMIDKKKLMMNGKRTTMR